MATTYVQAKVSLHCLVTEKRTTTDGPPNDGHQYNDIHHCATQRIDRNEWRWRFETAVAILCSGYADTTGYYTGDVLGGKFI